MAEYIDREKLYKDLLFGDDDDYIEAYSKGMIEEAPTADVVERSKIDKAIEEIKEASFKHYFENGEYIGEDTEQWGIVELDRVLEILKRNMRE